MSKPDFTGVWRLNDAKSVMKSGKLLELLMKITHRGSDIRQQVLSVREGGELKQSFVVRIGDESVNAAQGMTLTVQANWKDDTLVLESRVSGRDMRFEDHWSLSDDGSTLTMAHHDDPLAGQIAVFDQGSDAEAKRFD